MTQIITDKKFIAHALIGAAYWGVAPKFIPISRSAAFLQGAALPISMVAQQRINKPLYKALLPFVCTGVVGAFLKLPLKVNLFSSLAFTLLNQLVVRAKMPASTSKPSQKPRVVKQLKPVEPEGEDTELPIDEPSQSPRAGDELEPVEPEGEVTELPIDEPPQSPRAVDELEPVELEGEDTELSINEPLQSPRAVDELEPVEPEGEVTELSIDEPPLKIRVGTSITCRPYNPAARDRFVQLDIAALEQGTTKATASIHPIEFILSFDKSGSMQRRRIEQVRAVLSGLLDKISGELQTNPDRKVFLSIVTFESRAETYTRKVQVTPSNIATLKEKVEALQAGGITDIMAELVEGTTQLETAHDVAACASLIFLTAGKDIHSNKSQLRRLQGKWMDLGANFFASGIGAWHKAYVINSITTKKSAELLADTFCQWVPDATPECEGRWVQAPQQESTERVTLEEAVNAIFQQSLSQAIQSISVKPTASFDVSVSVCNGDPGPDGSYELGGLSIGQRIRRYLRAEFSDSNTKLKLEVTVRTSAASHVLPVQFKLSPAEYDLTIYKGALEHMSLQCTNEDMYRRIRGAAQKIKDLLQQSVIAGRFHIRA